MQKRIYLIQVIGVLLLITAAGCSESPTKQSAPTPLSVQPKSAITSTVTSTVVQEPVEPEYSYKPAGRRDPFTPIVIKEEKKGVAGAKSPLERFPITEFKLAGIVWGGLGYHAMLEGPDGKGYFVRPGMVIGPNRGVIKKITQNAMIIEESFKDPTGEVTKKEIVVEFRKKAEGIP